MCELLAQKYKYGRLRCASTKVQILTPELRARQERERAAEQVRLRERRAAVVQELREQVLGLLALLVRQYNKKYL